VFYAYLDLDELDKVFARRWFWSTRRPALAWFRQADYLGPRKVHLRRAIANIVEEHTGQCPQGPIRLLSHLRYFGYGFNPVSFYYCFDASGSRVETIVTEVTNTPWGERHCYVLPQDRDVSPAKHARFKLDKVFHVSPFMPMDIQYEWVFSAPGHYLSVHMENYRAGEKIFDATMALGQRPINARNCSLALMRYPFMTLKVIGAIYWQAFRLLLKGTPLCTHPGKLDHSHGGAHAAKSL
jgi:DUF1365 family protein